MCLFKMFLGIVAIIILSMVKASTHKNGYILSEYTFVSGSKLSLEKHYQSFKG